MFRRIKLLTLLQLSDRIKFKKSANTKAAAAKIGILLFTLIVITAICTGLVWLFCDLLSIPKSNALITFIIFLLQIMSVISCTSGLLRTLYLGKDNAILLSYPAHHVEVFLSKILVFYIYEFIKGIFMTLPLLIGFGIIYQMISVVYILMVILLVFLLPLFPVLIGAFLTMTLLFINRLLNKEAINFTKKGKEYYYFSIISEEECVREESESFLNKVFNGSLNSMMTNFVKSQKLTNTEINELKSILNNYETQEKEQ